MSYLKLGEVLIEQGFITEEQLKAAISRQKAQKGGLLGEILIGQGVVTEEDLCNALGSQLNIPFYSSENPELLRPQYNQGLEKLVPSEFAQKNYVLPISKHMNSLTCAVFDPLDLILVDNLRKITGYEINLIIATKSTINKAIATFYFKENKLEGKSSMLDQAVQKSYIKNQASSSFVTAAKDDALSAELSMDKLIQKAGEAPVIKLVDLIIRQAIDERASDIHIEPFDNKLQLRYRIDGNLYTIPPPSAHLHLPIVSRIKILSKLDIAEKRLPQDGAIRAKLENRTVDIRISTIPTVWGEKVVMRILDKAAVPLELASLGFSANQIEILRKAIARPYGLFFVTGPTGSGKSTSLYAALTETIDPKKNIISVEDPVEFKIEGVNQVNIRNEIGLNFATALKAFLRQDPDVIMVGEVRDIETASICVRAALTGHLVLSTLHTNDAAAAITRLIDIGIPNYLITPSLILVLAQRLSRRLCPNCKEAYEPTPAQHGGVEIKSDLIYKAKGCEDCNHTGFKGQIVIPEILTIDDDIRNLISKNPSHLEIKDLARKNGMATLFESGIKLVEKGYTSFDEVCRVTTM